MAFDNESESIIVFNSDCRRAIVELLYGYNFYFNIYGSVFVQRISLIVCDL